MTSPRFYPAAVLGRRVWPALVVTFAAGCGDGEQDGAGGQGGGGARMCKTAPVVTDPAQPVGHAKKLFAASGNACAVLGVGATIPSVSSASPISGAPRCPRSSKG
jgi:hypothetical protein